MSDPVTPDPAQVDVAELRLTRAELKALALARQGHLALTDEQIAAVERIVADRMRGVEDLRARLEAAEAKVAAVEALCLDAERYPRDTPAGVLWPSNIRAALERTP